MTTMISEVYDAFICAGVPAGQGFSFISRYFSAHATIIL